MPLRPSILSETIAKRWRTDLMGCPAKPRSHWKTKVAYYRAAAEVLTLGDPFTWRDVVSAVRPRGSSSTFYEVAGPNARHGLINAYRKASDGISLQIAYEYRRDEALDYLIDEAKVWSFWEYREAFLRTHDEADRLPIDEYVEALAAWASVHRPLATALTFAPPVCAVEDLVALHPGGLAPMRARDRLTSVVYEAVHRPEPPDPVDPSELDDITPRIPAHELAGPRTPLPA